MPLFARDQYAFEFPRGLVLARGMFLYAHAALYKVVVFLAVLRALHVFVYSTHGRCGFAAVRHVRAVTQLLAFVSFRGMCRACTPHIEFQVANAAFQALLWHGAIFFLLAP